MSTLGQSGVAALPLFLLIDLGIDIIMVLGWYDFRYLMPIDDYPFDALKQQFRMEDLSVSPVGRAIVTFSSCGI